jgi:hypothetical protein
MVIGTGLDREDQYSILTKAMECGFEPLDTRTDP